MEAQAGRRRGQAARRGDEREPAGDPGPHRRLERATVGLLLLGVAVGVASCRQGVDREIPKIIRHPTFLSVTNDAQGPLAIGSERGVYVSDDAGRSWRLSRPHAIGARAIGYTRTLAVITMDHGGQRQTMDLAIRRKHGPVVNWRFGHPVTAMASSPGHGRLWALTEGRRVQLWYTNSDGRRWAELPAIDLCGHPRAMANVHQKDGSERLYVACGEDGLMVSTNIGVSFSRVAGITDAGDVATSQGDPRFVAVVTPLVTISRDGGQTWDVRSLSAIRVAASPRNSKLVVAIAENGHLFASVDGGHSF